MSEDPRIEAVARAMWIAQYTENYDEREEGTADAWDNPDMPERWRKEYRTLARAALAAADAAAWRPMSEAPRDGTRVLWCGSDKLTEKTMAVVWWPEYEACFEFGGWFMHLPTPPQEQE